ncbi:MAG TPA: hypothetical protein QKA08_02070 [Candidatus Megaira endosymbiont of Nemacystus decipiens]|nr:hypothetical protein [Candidatus Megaera endosymbiont of Nemacystus decipiens]
MIKKPKIKLILIPICCLLMLIASGVSADGIVPPLPADNGPELMLSDSEKEISTWQKIKSFFGMGPDQGTKPLDTSEQNDKKTQDASETVSLKKIEDEDNTADKLMSPEDFIEEVDRKLPDSEIQGTQDMEDQSIILPINNSIDQQQTKLDFLDEEFEIPSLDDEVSSVDEDDIYGSDSEIGNEGSEIPTLNQSTDLKIQDDTEQLISAEEEVELKRRENNDSEIGEVQDTVMESKKEEIVLTVPDYDSEDPEEVGAKSDRSLTPAVPSLENKTQNQKSLNQDKIKQDRMEEKDIRKLQKFISDEIQVLLLPNDDVVLGEVTRKARLAQMSFADYIRVFWQKYDKLVRQEETRAIKDFIDSYDETFNQSD